MMIKTTPIFAFFALIAAGLYISAMATKTAGATGNAPIVIELFTSQSCSSCPPADKLLGELAKQENIIALSCNVTYWNHLHWKDTLSKQFCTDRQRDYSAAMGRNNVFTPQMVINGNQSATGSRRGEVTRALKTASPVKSIGLTRQNQTLTITLPQYADTNSTLYLVTYSQDHTQNIPSGENRGRTVHYTNPVTALTAIGTWDGTAQTMTATIDNNAAGYAVIAQQDRMGAIIAAGAL